MVSEEMSNELSQQTARRERIHLPWSNLVMLICLAAMLLLIRGPRLARSQSSQMNSLVNVGWSLISGSSVRLPVMQSSEVSRSSSPLPHIL